MCCILNGAAQKLEESQQSLKRVRYSFEQNGRSLKNHSGVPGLVYRLEALVFNIEFWGVNISDFYWNMGTHPKGCSDLETLVSELAHFPAALRKFLPWRWCMV